MKQQISLKMLLSVIVLLLGRRPIFAIDRAIVLKTADLEYKITQNNKKEWIVSRSQGTQKLVSSLSHPGVNYAALYSDLENSFNQKWFSKASRCGSSDSFLERNDTIH